MSFQEKEFNMKKRVLFTVVMMLFAWVSSANPDIYVGAVGGMNHSNFIAADDNPFGVDPDEFHKQSVYGFGGVLEMPVASFLSLRIQPMILQRHSSYEPAGENLAYLYKISYLEVPVLFKAVIGETVKPYLLAGVSAGFELNSSVEVSDGNINGEGDLNAITKDLNLSLVLGAGFSYDTGKFVVFAEGLFYHGLQNINKGGIIDIDMNGFTISEEVDPLEAKTRDLQIMVGVLIPLGKKGS